MRTIVMAATLLAAAPAWGGLTFPETLREVHATADAEAVTMDFEFTNEGKETVTIRHYDAPCSCLSAQIKGSKLTYAPGETGVIRANFSLGTFSGTVDKQIILWLRGDPDDNPSIKLTARVHIPVLVDLEPKTLKWTLGESPVTKEIRIKVNHTAPIRVLEVSGSNDRFSHELKTVRDGGEYVVSVTPADTGTPGIGVLRIETDSQSKRHRIQQAFLVVRRELPSGS